MRGGAWPSDTARLSQETHRNDSDRTGRQAAAPVSSTPTTTDSSDAELIERVRSGDLDAYGELFARHREAANRLARQLVRGPDSDDLVAEGFSRVLGALQNGKGPDEFFRAYLLTSIRRLHVDRIRAAKRVKTTADESELDRAVAFVDPAEMKFEQSTAATAFASLPERWQLVLWHLDVEGQKPAEVAPLLGMTPNSVSALAYRAREGLRTAYLQGHLAPAIDDGCRRTTPLLAQHVRNNLSKRDAGQVDAHLDTCARCSGLYAELTEVNNHLAGLLAPALLGVAATGYLASSSSIVGVGLLAQLAHSMSRPFRWAAAGTSAGASSGIVVAAVSTLIIAGSAVAVSQLANDDAKVIDESAKTLSTAPSTPPASIAPPAPEVSRLERQPPRPTVNPPVSVLTPQPPIEPAPTADPLPPAEAPAIKPSPGPDTMPTFSPVTEDPATAEPTPEPTPSPEPPGPTSTDYGVNIAGFTDQAPDLQRRLSIGITAVGDEPRQNIMTVSLAFDAENGDNVTYQGGVSSEWNCGEPPIGSIITSLTCTREQTGTDVPPLEFSLHGWRPRVIVSITASHNTDTTELNNSDELRAAPWVAP